ncbi:FHA domain-containing protein [Chroococcidiopsis sp. TS-821]|uniref:FHA domain-containing protein n=1 Tax=Chroococcidiopsis sp. TS-821 TaxID=1378066 RepID=UPI000CEDD75C|nr:FHA domain-containing protein [Chroococcidiopsis sp. TS-821]
MITLILLHPLHSTPIQNWTFTDESVIRVGRATDNDVVLYSAVVSRKHIELQCRNGNWEIVSLGANGTFIDDQRITKMPVVDGITIRLAQSGPQIQIRLGVASTPIQETKKPVLQPKPEAKPFKEQTSTRDTAIETIFGEPLEFPAATPKEPSKETVIGEPFRKYPKD